MIYKEGFFQNEISVFTFDLGTTITDVKLIEILSTDFVNILQNVDTSKNRLNWVDSLGVTHFDEITPGNYNTTQLLTAIGETMTNSTTAADYYTATLDFDTSENKQNLTHQQNYWYRLIVQFLQ